MFQHVVDYLLSIVFIGIFHFAVITHLPSDVVGSVDVVGVNLFLCQRLGLPLEISCSSVDFIDVNFRLPQEISCSSVDFIDVNFPQEISPPLGLEKAQDKKDQKCKDKSTCFNDEILKVNFCVPEMATGPATNEEKSEETSSCSLLRVSVALLATDSWSEQCFS